MIEKENFRQSLVKKLTNLIRKFGNLLNLLSKFGKIRNRWTGCSKEKDSSVHIHKTHLKF